MNKKILFVCIGIFICGWLCSSFYNNYLDKKEYDSAYNAIDNINKLSYDLAGLKEKPKELEGLQADDVLNPTIDIIEEEIKNKPSPYDWVKEDQIKVFNDRVIIEIENAKWSTFTNTKSMDPIIDEDSNAIEITPQSEDDIHIGDIVSYKSRYAEGIFIHRIIDKGTDSYGTYYIIKGDNNPKPDPGKIRFNQIERVLIGIIY